MARDVGSNINQYKIISRLGSGGMGEVYLAQDVRLQRNVALKLLHENVTANEDWVRRFEQEARAASALNHPNIITIYEVGQEGESHFISAEFIEGETLRQRLRKNTLNVGEALDIAIQVATALVAAHVVGIIHRDIKPENIMLRPDGYVKVLDFGLAKFTEEPPFGSGGSDPNAATNVNTSPGTVMGTVSYMSPEQASGRHVDARTDIFSLGVLLYEMLAGRLPFDGASPSEIIVSILQSRPRPLARFAPEVPPELERIVAKSLSKNRDERYQTLKDMVIDLKKLKQQFDLEEQLVDLPDHISSGDYMTGGGGGGMRTGSGGMRTGGSGMRIGGSGMRTGSGGMVAGSGGMVAASGGMVAASGGMVAASGSMQTVTGSQQTQQLSSPNQLSSAQYIATGIKNYKWAVLIGIAVVLLAIVGVRYYLVTRPLDTIAVMPFSTIGSDPVTQQLADDIGERVNSQLSDLPGLTVQSFSAMQRYKGQVIDPRAVGRELNVDAVMMGRVIKRENNYQITAELINTRDGSVVVSPIQTVSFADVLLVPNKIVAAVSASNKIGLRMNSDEKKKKDAETLCVNGRNAWNKRTAEGFNDAIKNYNEALALDPKSAEALTGLADCYNFLPTYGAMAPRESYPKAHDSAIKALTIDPQHGEAHASLGYTTMRSDWNAAEAENEFKLAISQDPAYSSAHQWYANLLVTQGRADEAEAEVRRAQDLDKTSLIVKSHMANIDYYAHRYDQSITECQKVIAVDPSYFVAHRFMGLSYAQKGMYKEALVEAEKAITGSSTSSLVRADYASTLALSGDTKRAQDELNNLLAQQKQKYVSAFHIAFVYACLKDKEHAFEWLEKAYQEHNDWLVYLNVDPRFTDLHSDPRFTNLWSRIKAG